MATWKTRLAMLVVLAVTASTLVVAPPSGAQTSGKGPSPAPDVKPVLPAPKAFAPAPPRLTAADTALLTEAPLPASSSALRRPGAGKVTPSQGTTATSRHSVNAAGKGTAELFLKPAFRRKGGRWVEVDSTLGRSSRADQPVAAEGALRPVRFGTSADRIVELGLDQGPVTLSSPGLALSRPTLAADNTVVYANVAPDTDLRTWWATTG